MNKFFFRSQSNRVLKTQDNQLISVELSILDIFCFRIYIGKPETIFSVLRKLIINVENKLFLNNRIYSSFNRNNNGYNLKNHALVIHSKYLKNIIVNGRMKKN